MCGCARVSWKCQGSGNVELEADMMKSTLKR